MAEGDGPERVGGWLATTAVGIAIFALVVLLHLWFEQSTGRLLITHSVLLIVPAAGLMLGFVGALGYLFAALWFQVKPTGSLLAEMLLIAAIAQIGIYAASYAALPFHYYSFAEYLRIVLAETSYEIVREGRDPVDLGPLGGYGYALALLQFGGFLFGSLFVFWLLRRRAVCATCGSYVRTLFRQRQYFASHDEFHTYYQELPTIAVNSPGFAALARQGVGRPASDSQARLATKLRGCPVCGAQALHQTVALGGGKQWHPVRGLARTLLLPSGSDLVPLYRGERGPNLREMWPANLL